MERAILYNKYKAVLDLKMENGEAVEITKVLDYDFLPMFLQREDREYINLDRLNRWINKRKLPKNRDGINSARKNFGEFENHHCMFSLSDQYWFRYHESETWRGLNFFTNPYDEDLGKIFFSPWEVDLSKVSSRSPDLTTNGVLKKRWVRGEDGASYLIKAGSKDHHQDPMSEVLASITLKRLNIIPFVKYELTVDGLMLCSKCKNFVDQNTEFVPAGHIYYKRKRAENEDTYTHLLTLCEEYGIEGAKEYVDNMIAADHIIGNDDRHLGNFGFLRSAETGKIIGFAPLFDSGSAYWGKAAVKPKAKCFNERAEMQAFNAVMKRTKFNIEQTHREMFALIDKYPEISKKKRDEIKQRIDAAEAELEASINAIQGKNTKRSDRDTR